MLKASSGPLRLACVALGAALSLAYVAWQCAEPHGAFEFAYGPMSMSLPYGPMRGFTYEQLWGHVRRACLLGPGLFLLVWGLAGRLRLPAPAELRRPMLWCCGASLLACALVMLGVLRGRALIDDELSYAMQARFFGAGRLAGIEVGESPPDPFSIATRLGYTGKYLPGEGLLQVPGSWLGVPALLHLPVLALTFWAFYEAVRRSSGERFARLATAALACSPMLILTSATGLSHAAALLWITLMGLAVERARAGLVSSAALLSGVSFSAGLLTRPQSLIPAGAVLGGALVLVLWQRRAWAALGMATLTAGCGVAALLAYNTALSGSPLRLPWFLACDPEHFGFGPVWQSLTYEHSPLRALENLLVVALRLNAWWLGLPLSLGVLGAWLAWRRPIAGGGGATLWLWVGAAIVLFELFYYSPGASETGAIYHYELLLPGSIIAAAVAERVLKWQAGPLVLLAGLVLGSGSWLLEQSLRLERLVTTIHRDSEQALARIETPALVLHEQRASERVPRGWLTSSFPQRFREREAPVVTWPRSSSQSRGLAERAYPGRHCYYFRYQPGSARTELLRCQAAQALLEREASAPDDVAPYFERPTAYFQSSFSPAADAAALRKPAAASRPGKDPRCDSGPR